MSPWDSKSILTGRIFLDMGWKIITWVLVGWVWIWLDLILELITRLVYCSHFVPCRGVVGRVPCVIRCL
jgi:hypothetical protein